MLLYRQWDGYFHGMGKEIVQFVRKGTLKNGYNIDDKYNKVFGDMGDFACQLIEHFKKPRLDRFKNKMVQTIGNFHIMPLDTPHEYFHYQIRVRDGKIVVDGCGDYFDSERDIVEEFKAPVQLWPLTKVGRRLMKMESVAKKS